MPNIVLTKHISQEKRHLAHGRSYIYFGMNLLRVLESMRCNLISKSCIESKRRHGINNLAQDLRTLTKTSSRLSENHISSSAWDQIDGVVTWVILYFEPDYAKCADLRSGSTNVHCLITDAVQNCEGCGGPRYDHQKPWNSKRHISFQQWIDFRLVFVVTGKSCYELSILILWSSQWISVRCFLVILATMQLQFPLTSETWCFNRYHFWQPRP